MLGAKYSRQSIKRNDEAVNALQASKERTFHVHMLVDSLCIVGVLKGEGVVLVTRQAESGQVSQYSRFLPSVSQNFFLVQFSNIKVTYNKVCILVSFGNCISSLS